MNLHHSAPEALRSRRSGIFFRLASATLIAACSGEGALDLATSLESSEAPDGAIPPPPDAVAHVPTPRADDAAVVADAATTADGAADAAVANDAGTRTLLFVNALTDLGPRASNGATVRLCFRAVSGASAAFPVGAMETGTARTMHEPFATLAAVAIEPVVMNAAALTARGVVASDAGIEPSCDDLLSPTFASPLGGDGGGALVAGEDYWTLPPLPAGTIDAARSYLLVLTGCPGDSVVPPAKCGHGFVSDGGKGVGSLSLDVLDVSDPPPAHDALGVRFVNASPAAQDVLRRVFVVSMYPGLVDPTDGGFTPLSSTSMKVGAMTASRAVRGATDATLLAAAPRSRMSASGPLLTMSFTLIRANSYAASPALPTSYRAGHNVVFVALGDPELAVTPPFVLTDGGPSDGGAGSRANPRAFRYLGFDVPPSSATTP